MRQRSRSASTRLIVALGLFACILLGTVSWAQPAAKIARQAVAASQPAATVAVDVNKAAVVPPKVFTVPQVRGMNVIAARDALEKAGFSSAVAPGQDLGQTVRRTDPDAGARFSGNQARPTVVIFVQPAPPSQTVPSIVGQTCAQARQTLVAAKLTLASCEIGQAKGQVPAGSINEQQPQGGTPYQGPAPRVHARVEPPPKPVTVVVPNVVGYPALEAEGRVRDARLYPHLSIVPARPWHFVTDQNPEANMRAAPGTEVRLALAARHRVPSLIGRSCVDARQRVLEAGFTSFACGTEAVAGAAAPGRIHRQQPPAGSQHAQPVAVSAWTPLDRVPVPALVGSSEDAADRALSKAGLSGRKFGPSAQRGRVVSEQSPSAGEEVAPGTSVSLRLALRVPSLSNHSCDEADRLVREHGFATLTCLLQRTAPQQPLRRIFEQSPAAGTTLTAPQPLHAVAAQGIVVPKVVDLDLPAALARLQALGLVGRAQSSNGERRVVTQVPPEGEEVAPLSEVRLVTVRIGAVPDVVGTTLEEARGRLSASGFKSTSEPNDSPSVRRIVSQRPAANTKAAIGSSVALTTVIDVIVPDTIGKSPDEARAAIVAAGLSLGRLTDSARSGHKIVRHQSPSAGARAPAGHAVDLTLLTRVSVPDLAGRSCDQARIEAVASGLAIASCTVLKPSWLPFVIGTPQVVTQSRTVGSEADEGASLDLSAKGAVAQTLALLLSPLAAVAALFMAKPVPSSTFGVDDVQLRVVADRMPAVTVTIEPYRGDAPAVAWRAERGVVDAVIRAWSDLTPRR